MSLNDLNSKLTPRQIEIAIEAIGRRATGSPTEVALQILQGIAVLDGAHLPNTIWPEDYSLVDKAKWHAEQAEIFAKRDKWLEEFRLSWPSASSTEHPESPGDPDPAAPPDMHAPEAQAHEAHQGAPAAAASELEKKRDQGASDASA